MLRNLYRQMELFAGFSQALAELAQSPGGFYMADARPGSHFGVEIPQGHEWQEKHMGCFTVLGMFCRFCFFVVMFICLLFVLFCWCFVVVWFWGAAKSSRFFATILRLEMVVPSQKVAL